MNERIDIIDLLQEENGYVKLELTSGNAVFGLPQCIVFDEDEEGWETIKTIMFESYGSRHTVFYKLEDIRSYESINEEDIPTVSSHL